MIVDRQDSDTKLITQSDMRRNDQHDQALPPQVKTRPKKITATIIPGLSCSQEQHDPNINEGVLSFWHFPQSSEFVSRPGIN